MKVAEKGCFKLVAENREGLILTDEILYGTEADALEREKDLYKEDDVYRVEVFDERPRWDMYSMRQFCIDHDYFNGGTNKAYSSLLNYVETREPSEKSVRTVVIWILTHTSKFEDILDAEDEKFEEVFDYLACEIWNEAIYTGGCIY